MWQFVNIIEQYNGAYLRNDRNIKFIFDKGEYFVRNLKITCKNDL